MQRLVAEDRIGKHDLSHTERAAARQLIDDEIAEELNRRLRLRAEARYSAFHADAL